MLNPLDLTGRTVVVTGASSGIGRDTAIFLSQLGAKLIVAGRDQARLSAVLAELEGSGHRAEIMNLAEPSGIPAWLKTLSVAGGPISGLVHCAGAQVLRPLRLLTETEIADLLKLNVTAALMLAKGFRQKGVNPSGGSVVFISSVMGLVGAPGRSAYCASKSALHSLTKSLALELAPERIRVNCVAPGFVRTGMLAEVEAALGGEQFRRIEEMHPLGFGEPRDVSQAIAFLLSDMSRWITGTTLVADGGYTAH